MQVPLNACKCMTSKCKAPLNARVLAYMPRLHLQSTRLRLERPPTTCAQGVSTPHEEVTGETECTIDSCRPLVSVKPTYSWRAERRGEKVDRVAGCNRAYSGGPSLAALDRQLVDLLKEKTTFSADAIALKPLSIEDAAPHPVNKPPILHDTSYRQHGHK